ncbi:MAG: restriction endonuclease subunit S [Sandaracinaceae bacterium]
MEPTRDSDRWWKRGIPADWKVIRLKFLLDGIEQGWSPECHSTPAGPEEWGVLKAGCCNEGRFRPEENKTLPADLDPIVEHEVREGDVLMSRASGSPALIGSVARVPSDVRSQLMISDKLYRLRVNDRRVDADFLVMTMGSSIGRYQVVAAISGASGLANNISQASVKEFVLPLPPLGTQRTIADFLDAETARIDALIAAKENLLAILAEQRRALVTHAVTRGLDPSVPMRDSGVPWLGEIPAHWEVTRLKLVATVQSGLALGKKYGSEELTEYPYLRVANVQDGYLDLSAVKTVEVSERDAIGCRLQAGDVLMNEGGDADKLGRGAIWTGEIDPCLHQNHVFAVRPQRVSSGWLNLWTSGDGAKAYFESRSKQSTNLASISAANLKELPIPAPPVEEQASLIQHVNSELEKLGRTESATYTTISLLRERREAVIAAAVTGQLEPEAS